MDILDAIGNTSLVRLRKVVPPGCADIFVKLEWENPTGSVKDRMAQAVISRAEEDGRLKPGDTVVEYTGGSTGTSLALVCAAKGYRIRIVSSDAFSQEKRDHMAALGAELTLVPSEGGLTTKKLILDMIEAARELSQEPHTYWTDQLNNHDSIAGYYPLGEEIWSQTEGRGRRLRPLRGHGGLLARRRHRAEATQAERQDRRRRAGGIVGAARAVRPGRTRSRASGSATRLRSGSRLWWTRSCRSATDDAKEMARRLAREEALFAGTSSGANVVAAIRVAERLGPGATVVTLMADSGLKYLSTDVYRSRSERAPSAV